MASVSSSSYDSALLDSDPSSEVELQRDYARIPPDADRVSRVVRQSLPLDAMANVMAFVGPHSRNLIESAHNHPPLQAALQAARTDDMVRWPEGSFIQRNLDLFIRANRGLSIESPEFYTRFREFIVSKLRAISSKKATPFEIPENWDMGKINEMAVAQEECKGRIVETQNAIRLILCMEYLFRSNLGPADGVFHRELTAILGLPLTVLEKARRLRACLNQDGRTYEIPVPVNIMRFFNAYERIIQLVGFPPELAPILEAARGAAGGNEVLIGRLNQINGIFLVKAISLGRDSFSVIRDMMGNVEFIRRGIELQLFQPSEALDDIFVDLCKGGEPLELISILLNSNLLRAGAIQYGFRMSVFHARTELVRQLIDHPALRTIDRLDSWYWSSRTSSVINVLLPALLLGPTQVATIVGGGGAPEVMIPVINSVVACACAHWCASPAPCWTGRCLLNTTPCTKDGRETHQVIHQRVFGPSAHVMQ